MSARLVDIVERTIGPLTHESLPLDSWGYPDRSWWSTIVALLESRPGERIECWRIVGGRGLLVERGSEQCVLAWSPPREPRIVAL